MQQTDYNSRDGQRQPSAYSNSWTGEPDERETDDFRNSAERGPQYDWEPEREAPRRSVRREQRYSREPVRDAFEEIEAPARQEAPQEERKKHHVFPVILLILLLLAAVIAGAVYIVLSSLSGKTNYAPFDPIAEEAAYDLPAKGQNGVENILLIGTDARDPNVESRSDAMIVVSICPEQHKIYMTSILRDSYVDIPGYGMNRINHAFQMGGPRLLIQTIEQNFGIRIDRYVKVDFYSFVDIIDSAGGVEIEVTDAEVQYINGYLSEINQLMGIAPEDSFLAAGGTYTLNGRQALAYSRIRYIGTDFQRTERQRIVLEALVGKLKHSSPKTIYSAADAVLKDLTTDIPDSEMTKLMLRGISLMNYEMVSERIPYDGLWWNELTPSGQEVLGIDFPQTRAKFRENVYGE